MVRRALAVAILAACGSSTPPAAVVDRAPPPDAGPPPPLAEGCPARFDEAGGACDAAAGASTCHYPEGFCSCGPVPVCSGAVMPPPEEPEPTVWTCTPHPPAVRDDGCPGREPSGACARDGQRCSYGACCVSHYQCDDGTWQYTGGECPP
jgi:hypothetical protein